MQRTHKDTLAWDRRRFDAALAFQGRSLARFTIALGRWSPRHVALVMGGSREGSAALLDAIRHELGEHVWRFVTGEVDTLTDERSQHAKP
jgi:hypothetical protein